MGNYSLSFPSQKQKILFIVFISFCRSSFAKRKRISSLKSACSWTGPKEENIRLNSIDNMR